MRAAREPLTPPASSAASLNEDYINDVEYKTGVDFRNFGYGSVGYCPVDLGEIEDDDEQVTEEPDRGHWKVFISFLLYYFPQGLPPPAFCLCSNHVIRGVHTVAWCMDSERGEAG